MINGIFYNYYYYLSKYYNNNTLILALYTIVFEMILLIPYIVLGWAYFLKHKIPNDVAVLGYIILIYAIAFISINALYFLPQKRYLKIVNNKEKYGVKKYRIATSVITGAFWAIIIFSAIRGK